jgi:hypothetical protein
MADPPAFDVRYQLTPDEHVPMFESKALELAGTGQGFVVLVCADRISAADLQRAHFFCGTDQQVAH